MTSHVLAALSCWALAAVLPAQQTLHTLVGDSPGDHFGTAVASAGDVDGDGFEDVIAGAPFDDDNGADAGSARVHSGRDGSVLLTLRGTAAGDRFGSAVAGAGDVDGDGHADVIVGAPRNGSGGTGDGYAVVFSGGDGSVLHTFSGPTGSAFGGAVDSAGDTDDDGYADVIVGATGERIATVPVGSARVFSGRTGTVLHALFGAVNGDQFGHAVAGVGDLDDDGRDDFAVGIPFDDSAGVDAGRARVFSGRDASVLHTFDGDSAGDLFGWSLAGAGDVDRDFRPDVVVGAPADSTGLPGAGAAYVLSGFDGRVLHTFLGQAPNDALGQAVAGAGDSDADGWADIAVAAPNSDRNANGSGSVQVRSGRNGLLLYRLDGATAAESLGTSVAAGDVNCDGRGDLIVGVAFDDTNGADAGKALVVDLEAASYRRVALFRGSALGDQLGTSVAGAGDADHDGRDDVVLGAPGVGGNRGAAEIHSGSGGLLQTFTGAAAGDRLGTSVDGVGDVDGDGHADVIVGSPFWDDLSAIFGTDTGRADVVSGRTGASLTAITLPLGGFNGGYQLGWSVAGIGNANGGDPDVVVGVPNFGGVPLVQAFTGGGTKIWETLCLCTGDGFGASVAGAGDVNADGFDDVVISGGTRPAQVLSGLDGAILLTLPVADVVAGVGDVNDDGFDDVALGEPDDTSNGFAAGRVRVISGRDGTVLHTFLGGSTQRFGAAIACAGDVDADGCADLIVGAPGTPPFVIGRARVLSGRSGALLYELVGVDPGDEFGASVACAGDTQGTGGPDLLVGAPKDGSSGANVGGSALVYSKALRTDIGTFKTFGAGCAGSNGTLPRIGLDPRGGPPTIGTFYTPTLRSAPPDAPVALQIDVARSDIDLGFIGFAGCRALVLPLFLVNTTTNAAGRASRTLRVPNDQAYVGVPFHYQWVALDFAAPGIAMSDGGTIVFGRP